MHQTLRTHPSLNEKKKRYSTYACGQDCVFYIETTYISCHVEINKQVWSMQPIPLSHLFCATKNWQTRRRLGLFVAHHNWPKWFWKFLSIWLANMVASGSQLSSTSVWEGLFRMIIYYKVVLWEKSIFLLKCYYN